MGWYSVVCVFFPQDCTVISQDVALEVQSAQLCQRSGLVVPVLMATWKSGFGQPTPTYTGFLG